MKCKNFLSNFYKLLTVYKQNDNELNNVEEENALVEEFNELDDSCKKDFFITILNQLANKPETILSSTQEQELEIYNRKSLIDLKNSSTKLILISIILFILIVYITPSLLDSPVLKTLSGFLVEIFKTLLGE